MSLPECDATLDPRVRRTRQLLRDGLARLLQERAFEELTVQDIADAATVNRATVYDHYTDKFALLEAMVGQQFHDLLTRRGVTFDGTCSTAFRNLALGVCDYLALLPTASSEHQRQLEPHLKAAIIAVIRGMIREGIRKYPTFEGVTPDTVAAILSGAIFAGAKEWADRPGDATSEEAADTIRRLVEPVFAAARDSSVTGPAGI